MAKKRAKESPEGLLARALLEGGEPLRVLAVYHLAELKDRAARELERSPEDPDARRAGQDLGAIGAALGGDVELGEALAQAHERRRAAALRTARKRWKALPPPVRERRSLESLGPGLGDPDLAALAAARSGDALETLARACWRHLVEVDQLKLKALAARLLAGEGDAAQQVQGALDALAQRALPEEEPTEEERLWEELLELEWNDDYERALRAAEAGRALAEGGEAPEFPLQWVCKLADLRWRLGQEEAARAAVEEIIAAGEAWGDFGVVEDGLGRLERWARGPNSTEEAARMVEVAERRVELARRMNRPEHLARAEERLAGARDWLEVQRKLDSV